MKKSVLPCTREMYYFIAKISWLTCQKHIERFNKYSSRYTSDYVQFCEEEIDKALQEKSLSGIDKRLTDMSVKHKLNILYNDAHIVFKEQKNILAQYNYKNLFNIAKALMKLG